MRICLIGDYNPEVTAHKAIPLALALAGGEDAGGEWLDTESALGADLQPYSGFWCVPASPYRSMDGALRAIRFARENGVPFLGTCGGCQHALLEFARNVLQISAAGHREIDPHTSEPVITNLVCSLIEASETLKVVSGSRFREIYGEDTITETYRCSYGVSETYVPQFVKGGWKIGVLGPNGEARGLELDSHPFFLATLYQPERSALSGKRHPLVQAFVTAAATYAAKLACSATHSRERGSSFRSAQNQ